MGVSVSMAKRYHVHVCYATDDLVSERSILMQKMAKRCFFTWSLLDTSAMNTNYSRQQIDECDYVFFLVGSQYGSLAASGVSYLHLDFIYANTKQKPMLALLLENPSKSLAEPEDLAQHNKNVYNQRKLKDFRDSIINTCDNVYEFTSNADFANQLNTGFNHLVESHVCHGWTPSNTAGNVKNLTSPSGMNTADNSGEFAALGIEKTQLQDTLTLKYRVQAFKDGNFKEMYLHEEMSWGTLLSIIADAIRMPANEDVIAKTLHEYLDAGALEKVRKTMPEAHAAARSQINSKDVQTIKLQLAANDWLTTADYTASGKKLLILTPQGARQVTQWRGVVERMKVYS